MGQYSIKELEKLSGIKAHTIRIWEKRHHIVEPQRTDTNIRLYSDDDLKRIINVSLLNNLGIKISRIADMSHEEMNKKILELSEQKNEATIFIDQLILAMVDLDEDKFEKILSNLILRFGFERTITEIVYPFMEKIGVLWQTENVTPAQEHFISHLIRQKIIVAIDGLTTAPVTGKKALLFLPENEWHELGLLFFHYIVRKAGFKTYYLGQSVPFQDVVSVVNTHNPDIIITSLISSPFGTRVQDYLNRLSEAFPDKKVFASGYQIRHFEIKNFKNIQIFHNALNLKDLLALV
ncbi:MAG: MerR family transcriptional regulator [Cyclobacteriaceae bacterium]|jgi:DNA-binding transcriptional MerR regulator/methylmalonyl-CoA mutase cobalamin-binding subunit|nr:MerR family transcriptional regulator [Cyclobacteriaceae bacterium]